MAYITTYIHQALLDLKTYLNVQQVLNFADFNTTLGGIVSVPTFVYKIDLHAAYVEQDCGFDSFAIITLSYYESMPCNFKNKYAYIEYIQHILINLPSVIFQVNNSAEFSSQTGFMLDVGFLSSVPYVLGELGESPNQLLSVNITFKVFIKTTPVYLEIDTTNAITQSRLSYLCQEKS